ncbi:hypothetical protein VTJ83DRAFT_5061 [Remersonia thermophila]|uniref:Uncharacterized protein n=1 Tax=Remersonia thermophila TaxID=72144 RepID=A0ABR4DCN7_9PEZI
MSSPAQGGPPPQKGKEKEKKGLGKVLSRMKTVVLKKADQSRRRLSTLGLKAAPTTSAPAEAEASTSTPAPPTEAAPVAVEATKVPRSELFAERAKKLGEQFGLELPSTWYSTEGDVLRVEKPIKMRVHYYCHVCNSSFGISKECAKCKHQRCKQCKRVPSKRTEAQKEESRKKRAAILKERAEHQPIVPDWDPNPKKIVIKRPAKTGGQDLYYRKPRQRIRRTCCTCGKLFLNGKTCEGCQHVRCTDCPRDPPKKDKYPYGYPGDALGTRIGHYQCPECKHKFSIPPAAEVSCPKCSHPKVERLTPRKVEPEPDPELVKSVQDRLQNLKLKQ